MYTMNRLRDKEIGSAMAETYSIITDVAALDPTHVQFTLASPNAEFPALLADYHALMLCKSVEDPMQNLIGTGALCLTPSEPRTVPSSKGTPTIGASTRRGPSYPTWMRSSSSTRRNSPVRYRALREAWLTSSWA